MRAEKANSAAAVAAEVATSTFSDSVLTSDDFDDADDMELQDAIAYERKLNSHIIVPEYEESQQRTKMGPGDDHGNDNDTIQQAVRKRSSEEISEGEGNEDKEDDYEEEEEDHDLESGRGREDDYGPTERVWFSRKESPASMKRIKLSEETMHMATPTRKRSSEEMETADGERISTTMQDAGIGIAVGVNKKVRSEE